jgi:hypothetical protein
MGIAKSLRILHMHSPSHTRRAALTFASIFVIIAAGCGSQVPSESKCRNLEYKEEGLSRAEYLPCAGEIVAALDELAAQSQAASGGDRQARSDGRATLGRVEALIGAAGGRNLLEPWQDRTLTDLNVRINNAVTHYQAFYMVRIVDQPDQFAAQSRQAAAEELRAAVRRHDEARNHYRRLQ